MRIAVILLATIPFCSGSAFGWGCDGHQIVALIARAHLTPAASAAADRLLRENPIDAALTRFCKDHASDPMADSATWADDVRNIEKTAEWHFINIPLAVHSGSVPAGDAAKWCPPLGDGRPGCIVTAIDYEWAILRDGKQSGGARAKALRYLIHFLGDMAQPLHTVDNHDRGGNCTSVRFLADPKAQNLHSIWDTQLLARDLLREQSTPSKYATELDEKFSSRWPEWGESKTDIPGWVWESHRLAEDAVYGKLNPKIPVEPATAGEADQEACTAEREKVAALHISIGDAYATDAGPVYREQITRAGYRLAGLLNRTFQ